MPIRETQLVSGHYYHLFNRGANRQPIFFRSENWDFSSYRDYVGLRSGTLPQPGCVLGHFPSRQAYRDFVISERDCRLPSDLLVD